MPETRTPISFGRFTVVRELGRGAMGRVFLARDDALDRLVAIKVLGGLGGLAEADRRGAIERFRREARAAAALTHPNIVTVYDVGEHEGTPYLAMEYVEGTTLDRYTEPGHLLPPTKVLDVGIQAAAALDAAHRAGIVHRDIKPANLLLLPDGTVKITDFGLAKEGGASLTASDSLLGTPNYMSPEQIAGRRLDGRSDLFSLAVSLYELLCGRRPFPGDTISSVLYRIVNDPPVPLSKHRPDLPDSLDRFLFRALAKDPSKRPPDAAAFADGLRKILLELGGMPKDLQLPEPTGPVAPPPTAAGSRQPVGSTGRSTRSSRAPRRRRRLPRLLGALLLVLVAGAAALWTAPLWAPLDPLAEVRVPIEARLADWLGAAAGWINVGPVPRVIRVETDPPGLPVRVEPAGTARRADDGSYLLDPGKAPRVTFTVDDPCREGSRTVETKGDRTTLLIETTPVIWQVPLGSDPHGATVTLDGVRQVERTPLVLALEACREHVIEMTVPGRAPKTIELAAAKSPEQWKAMLESPALGEPLAGEIVVPKAPYRVRVSVAGTKIRSRAGRALSVPPGRRTVVLDAPEVFFHATRRVRVEPGGRVRLEISYPPLGTVPFRSVPPGAKVSIKDHRGRWREIGKTQIGGYKLVKGEYRVRFELEGRGVVERTVSVDAGRNPPVALGAREWSEH